MLIVFFLLSRMKLGQTAKQVASKSDCQGKQGMDSKS